MIIIEDQPQDALWGKRHTHSSDARTIQTELLVHTQTPSSEHTLVPITMAKPKDMSKALLSRIQHTIYCATQ